MALRAKHHSIMHYASKVCTASEALFSPYLRSLRDTDDSLLSGRLAVIRVFLFFFPTTILLLSCYDVTRSRQIILYNFSCIFCVYQTSVARRIGPDDSRTFDFCLFFLSGEETLFRLVCLMESGRQQRSSRPSTWNQLGKSELVPELFDVVMAGVGFRGGRLCWLDLQCIALWKGGRETQLPASDGAPCNWIECANEKKLFAHIVVSVFQSQTLRRPIRR